MFVVAGAARSGIAATRFLLSRGARVVLTDVKTEAELSQGLKQLRQAADVRGELILELGGHHPRSFRTCDCVVLSPGVPMSHPCLEESRKAGVPVMAEVELASRHLQGMLIGITGTNGKTTTTALAADLMRGSGIKAVAAGNIGSPLTGFVEASTADDVYVVELSSFQLETTLEFRPRIAAVLNVTPNHLDRYEGFDAYVAAKRRIFMNQDVSDHAVLNRDDARTAGMAGEVPSVAVLFSTRVPVERGAFLRGEIIVYRDGDSEQELLRTQDIPLRGRHNLENVLAGSAIAILAGARPHSIREAVRDFKGVEHRLEWVADILGVQYFNDSKATSVDATLKSLESFAANILLIMGGRDKAGDFSALRPAVARRVKRLVLIGEAAGRIREALGGYAETVDAAGLGEAVRECHRAASPGDVVLLAPACASFDMFEDFEHRGRVFKESVLDLGRES